MSVVEKLFSDEDMLAASFRESVERALAYCCVPRSELKMSDGYKELFQDKQNQLLALSKKLMELQKRVTELGNMKLFEVTTGWMGESYERCYIWAASEEAAKELFYSSHVHLSGNPPDSRSIRQVETLFAAGAEPFITALDGSGFGKKWTSPDNLESERLVE